MTKIRMPEEVRDIELAFGGDMKKLLPPMEEIPEEFKKGKHKFCDIIGKWFFQGLPKTTEFIPKEGIDPMQAINHIRAIMASFEPQHQHKEAGCSFLLSEWFVDISLEGFENEQKSV